MISYEKLMRWKAPVSHQSYDERDCAWYALAHGLGEDFENPAELRYVAKPVRQVFPTMPLALANEDRSLEYGGTGIDYSRVVLGEQSLEIHRPLPIAASVTSHGEVGRIVDNGVGRAAIVTLIRRLYDDAHPQAPLATMSASYIARAQGGFGGPVGAADTIPPLPDTSPQQVIELRLLPQLALLYDLTGNYVPFHVDPVEARKVGFQRPILHGLCTAGLAARAAMLASPDSAGRVNHVRIALGAVIYPGEALRFDLWSEDDGYRMRATAIERDAVVLRDAMVRFRR